MILKQDIEVIEAHLEQSSIIAQLYELYTYEGHDGMLVYRFMSQG